MPALVEVEILKRDLEREVVGRRVKEAIVRPSRNAMKVLAHGRRKEFEEFLVGAKVDSVFREGRKLYLKLDNGHALVFDLGEQGLLLKTSPSHDMATHTHIVIGFTIGGQLRLIDPSLTSQVCVVPASEVPEEGDESKFVMDPLNQHFTWHHFSELLEARDEPMKSLVMDDAFICGLGHIYSDEILFAAGLRYDHPSSNLTSQDVRRLYRGLMETLQEAMKARGTSVASHPFHDLQGTEGAYQQELQVFEREGLACRRCRQEIHKAKFDSIDTYFCPQCQH